MADRVAFFDVDGTLLPPPSMERRFLGWLLARRILGPRHLLRGALSIALNPPWTAARFKMNKMYLRGEAVDRLEALGAEYVTLAIIPALRRIALETIDHHRRQGDRVVLLTGSLDLLVGPLARKMGLDGAIAGRLERAGGHFTGCALAPHPYGEQKAEALRDYARRANIDLTRACLYSDSASDLPAFLLVGGATAVNPSPRLAREARRRGWAIAHWPDASSRRVLILS
ncbi:MAG: HAD family phosphatase [Nitrospirota bacterium]